MKDNLVDEVLYAEVYYLQDREEYSAEQIYAICKRLIKKAEDKGLTGCYLRFSSSYEAYEDYLGAPFITPCGYREMTEKEKADQLEQKVIYDYAEKQGITLYEAAALYKIRDKLGLEF